MGPRFVLGGLVLACALLFVKPLSAAGICIDPSVEKAFDDCPSSGPKKSVSGEHRPSFHGTVPQRKSPSRDARPPSPRKLPAPERDLRKARMKARGVALLIRETRGLERLLARTPAKSPDRLSLLRRIAEDYVELETAAEKQPTKKGKQLASAARKSAVRYYAEIAKRYPSYSKLDEVLYYLAYEHERIGDLESARKVYYELIQKTPKSRFVPNAYFAFGELFFQEAQGDPSKWELAAQAYQEAIKYPPPDNKAHGSARYKLAYVHWNRGELVEALNELKKVVEYGTQWASLPNATALARAARRDMVSVYAASGAPERAFAFFRPLSGDAGGETTRTIALLDQLGLAYLDTGHYREAITLYRDLLSRDPGLQSCHYQTEVTTATQALKSGDKPAIVAVLEEQLALQERFAKSGAPNSRKLECANRSAELVAETAMAWHLEAVGSGAVRGTNDPKTLAHAARLYRRVLDTFSAADFVQFRFPRIQKSDWPTRARLGYALADLDYARGNWADCAAGFDAVVEADPKGPDAAEAAWASLLCHKKQYDREHSEKASRTGRGLGPGDPESGATAWSKLAPRPLGDGEQRMITAFARYLCWIEPKKGDAAAVEQRVEVEFARARLYYDAQHWQEAALAFRHIALEHSDHDAGIFAAQLYLESLNVLYQRAEPKRTACLDDMGRDVPQLGRAYCSSARADVEADQCEVLARVEVDVGRKQIEALVARADAMPNGSPEALSLYSRAGDAYLGLYRKHCEPALSRGQRPKQCSRADELLYDTARAYQAAHLLAKANQARLVLLDPRLGLSDGPVAHRAIYELGTANQAIAAYDQAADYFERYVEATCRKGKCGEHAEPALHDAVVLRLGLGQPEQAIEEAKRYERWFGAKHPAQAAELAFAVAAHYGERSRWSDVRKRLSGALRVIDQNAALDVRLRAHALLGRAYVELRSRSAAEKQFAEVLTLWSDPKRAVATIEGAESDSTVATRKVGRALESVGEAHYFFAEEKKARVDAIRFPAYEGPGTKAAVLAHIHTKVAAWVSRKRPLIEDATREYAIIANLQPAAPPRWTIAAGARVGEMWGRFVDEFRAAPIPDSIRNDPELRAAYYEAIDKASEPQKLVAKSAYETCLGYSSRYQYWDDHSRACEVWLADHYKATHHLIDEFRGAPTRRNDVTSEHPSPALLSRVDPRP
jgi:tetratricopeptide (TPR) repeat protein